MTSIQANAVSDYNHLITTRPHDVRRVIISDLHLSADEPALVQAFLALLDDLIALPNLTEFYILGDWFDAWIGDDAYLSLSDSEKSKHWITPIINKLTELKDSGCHTFVMHGNRDFLITQDFCDSFGGTLIEEPYFIKLSNQTYRLEHGDALCTDDVSYQRFRKIMRNPVVQWLLLKRPLKKRQALAQKIRRKSSEGKRIKSYEIMDVNDDAEHKAIDEVDHLLHGHTHRPAVHSVIATDKARTDLQSSKLHSPKYRYVLGDWRLLDNTRGAKVEAVIGVTTIEHDSNSEGVEAFQLVKFTF